MTTDVVIGGVLFKPNQYVPQFSSNFKLNPRVQLTNDFRADMQTWCDNFFGMHRVFCTFGAVVVAHPANIAYLCANLPALYHPHQP